MEYKISIQAKRDIREITDYIKVDSYAAAIKQKDKLLNKIRFLCKFPHAGRERDELMPNYLSIVEGNYIIFYTIDSYINIARVFHSSRDFSPNYFQ